MNFIDYHARIHLKDDGTFGNSFAVYSDGHYDSDQKNIGEYPDSKIHLNFYKFIKISRK